MFTHLLDSFNELFGVIILDYAKRHFLKRFEKDYKGKIWDLTLESIKQDLSRLGFTNNKTQKTSQIDELKYIDGHWLCKYDFRIAGSKQSTKDSGNRAIIHIDKNIKTIQILLIYNKTDLPKNIKETDYIYRVIEEEYKDIYKKFNN